MSLIKKLTMLFFPLMLLLLALLLTQMSPQELLELGLEHPFLTIALALGLYALKSLSVLFPLVVLYAAVGALYPTWIAMIINTLGLVVTVSLPYWLGYRLGGNLAEEILNRYKKGDKIRKFKANQPWLLTYLIRATHLFPVDVVSLLLGSMQVRYRDYLLGSLMGFGPIMVVVTYVGHSFREMDWPQFLASGLFVVFWTLLPLFFRKGFAGQVA